jgi:hypothetical protein
MGKAILEDLVSSYGTPERALEAAASNAFDFLTTLKSGVQGYVEVNYILSKTQNCARTYAYCLLSAIVATKTGKLPPPPPPPPGNSRGF